MKLGDSLASLRQLSIQQGSVFKITLYPHEGVTPKNDCDKSRTKLVVIIGVEKESVLVGSLLINSDVNRILCHRIALYQHCIYQRYNQFLENTYSYVNCYQIKEIRYERIISEGQYLGMIAQEDLERIIQCANASPVNKPATLKKYGIDRK